jgi:hypothetical protein
VHVKVKWTRRRLDSFDKVPSNNEVALSQPGTSASPPLLDAALAGPKSLAARDVPPPSSPLYPLHTLSAALIKVQQTLSPTVKDTALTPAAETWPLSSPACKCLAQLPLPQMLFRRPMSSVSVSVAASVSGFGQRVICTSISPLVLSFSSASYILSTCLRFAVL